MKKKTKVLSLRKRTISNLDSDQMAAKAGGNPTNGKSCDGAYTCACDWTQRGRTCHNCGSF